MNCGKGVLILIDVGMEFNKLYVNIIILIVFVEFYIIFFI